MSNVPLDKESLKELRGKLLAQEKELSRQRNNKAGRQELYRKSDLGNDNSQSKKEEHSQNQSIEETDEMEMGM